MPNITNTSRREYRIALQTLRLSILKKILDRQFCDVNLLPLDDKKNVLGWVFVLVEQPDTRLEIQKTTGNCKYVHL